MSNRLLVGGEESTYQRMGLCGDSPPMRLAAGFAKSGLFAGEIKRLRINRMRGSWRWRWHLDEMDQTVLSCHAGAGRRGPGDVFNAAETARLLRALGSAA